jgi:tetratricopeptide (TPR) repeat protein
LFLMLLLVLSAEPRNAQEWFQRGRAEAKEGRHDSAIKAFERAQQLEPALGTLLNIADSLEKLGKPVEARQAFLELQVWALRVHDASRAAEAKRRIAALETLLARIELPLDVPADVTVVLNGQRLERGQPQFLPPGEYELVATAPGKQPWSTRLRVRPGAVTVPAVPALASVEAPPAPPPALQPRVEPIAAPAVSVVEAPPPMPVAVRHRTWSWVTLGLAGASLATAVALHVQASNDYQEYKLLNPGELRNQVGERSRLLYPISWGFYAGAGAVGLTSLLLFLFE